MGSFDVRHDSFDSWAGSLRTFREVVVRESREKSDAAGVFWRRVNDFLRFLTKEGKEDDPDTARLRRLFDEYTKLEDAELKKARLEILDLCLEICEKFQDELRRKVAAASIIAAL